jgi:hypothetical protein
MALAYDPGDLLEPRLALIPPSEIGRVLSRVLPWLEKVVERSHGGNTLEGFLKQFASGLWRLWIIDDGEKLRGMLVTELDITPSGLKVCTIRVVTGEDSVSWLHLSADLEAWAKEKGCTRMETWARKGWAKRLPDYHLTHVMLEKEIT